MAFLYYLIIVLHVMACLFLIAVVLLQQGKGQDLASAFGGGGSQTAFGPRGSATVLSRATTILAGLFMVTSLALSMSGRASGVLDQVPGRARDARARPRRRPPRPPAGPAAPAAEAPATTPGTPDPGRVVARPAGLARLRPCAAGAGGVGGRRRQRRDDLERLPDLDRLAREVVPDRHHDLVVAERRVRAGSRTVRVTLPSEVGLIAVAPCW